ncbi:MAG: 4-(cytidine 5'-diphospho)-2-C-methyl-D-erythritol kinase [Endomicrobium sp.]|jgi:4-diphosphocytidyl-2-C-methyl-D-erythritol kinase|nr:4-(cytidine 5'-diphospho)-2-C-methyl-D-erythritol kinase [Endomicrobium sp.]
MKLYLKAPAKINFFLEVKNKRTDGYHNLKSVMQTVSLYDELFFELTDSEILLECKNEHLPTNKENIVYKVAQIVKNHYDINEGVRIHLKKKIPIKAGLGGGSSDAASTFKALVKLWNIKTSKDKLEKIAVKLGADIPFFFTAGTALCEGVGEIITPLKNVKKLNIVLVNPGFGLSSKDVYKKIKFPLTNQVEINRIISSINNGSFDSKKAFNYCFNRLEEFVLPNYPGIARIKNVLNGIGCVSLMTGSGTTVFGIYDNSEEVKTTERLKSKLNKYKWKVWFVNTI